MIIITLYKLCPSLGALTRMKQILTCSGLEISNWLALSYSYQMCFLLNVTLKKKRKKSETKAVRDIKGGKNRSRI